MKLETYARRLAEKTNTPILEQILLGRAPFSDLPHTCMPWTGRTAGPKERRVKVRVMQNGPVQVEEKPYGVLVVEGKRIPAHRYIFMLMHRPQYEFRMRNDCGNTLCCNPMHWTVFGEPANEPEPCFEEEPWTQSDVNALLDQALATRQLNSWQDVTQCLLLLDCPHEMLVQALKEFRKTELLP